MRKKCIRLLAILLAFMLTWALAEEGELSFLSTFEPAPTPTVTPAPTPEPPIPESRLSDDGQVRVLLQSLNQPTMLHLTLRGLYALEGEKRAQFLEGAVVTLLSDGGTLWMGIGGLWQEMGDSVELLRYGLNADRTQGLLIRETGRDAIYPGSLKVTCEASGALRCVLTLDVEDYLCGVVGYEMSDSWPLEALKAQAVAARTYVLQRKAGGEQRDYDVTDTTSDQVFRGVDETLTNVLAAVAATEGVAGVYGGDYATCWYTASNGGQVARPEDVWPDAEPCGYIERKDDPYDFDNPRCEVRTAAFAEDLSDAPALLDLVVEALNEQLETPFHFLRVTAAEPSDPVPEDTRRYTRLKLIVLCETEKPAPTPGPTREDTAAPTGMPESAFLQLDTPEPTPEPTPTPEPEWEERTVEVSLDFFGSLKELLGLQINSGDYELLTAQAVEGGFQLETRRFGHGVGMSQRGAQRMAGVENFGWRQILEFYYPGMSLERVKMDRPEAEALQALPPGAESGVPLPTPSPAPLPALQAGETLATVSVTDGASMLNVRQMPTTQAAILDRFENGRQVIIASEEDENGWVRIRTAELEGYVKRMYLITEADAAAGA